MKWISGSFNRSLLWPAAGFGIAVALLAAGIGLTLYDNHLYKTQKLKDVSVQAQILADSEAASLDFDDPSASQEYLNALRANPEIDEAGVYDRSGRLVAAYTRSAPAKVPESSPGKGSSYDGGTVTVVEPVVRRDKAIGSVYVRAITEPFARRLPRYGAVLLLLTMASLVVAVLVIARTKLAHSNAMLLVEMQQREKTEEALRQSQKMEAIGQLTGGIAHDFNNMLAVITGNLSILLRRAAQGRTDLMQYAENALEGARRAATLTQQLLAFSRRQPLAPVPLSLNKLISGMSELLGRTIGEQIRFQTVIGAGLWSVFADQGQLETALINLVVNARDAMPDGGALTIETANASLDEAYVRDQDNIEPGQYVMIAVSDTGNGMTPDVVAKAFDPFFTTKPVGKGTGLGLSQVYGFVKQSWGHVRIYSEVNQGTTVKLYLPRHTSAGDHAPKVEDRRPLPSGLPHEIILVVEDEDKVRRVTTETLRELGYTVRHADGVRAALLILESQPNVNLLFTDIVMPDGSGRMLADEAKRRWPDIKVLFTTGYTRNAIVHNGVLDSDVELLMKPFSFDDLANKIRSVLGPTAAQWRN